jgi:hypothetical protein
MSVFIGLLRIVVGIAVLGLAGKVYFEHRLELAGTKDIMVDIVGFRFISNPQLLVLGIGIGGLIGVLALCAGIYGATHWPDRERERPKPAAPKAAAPGDGAT